MANVVEQMAKGGDQSASLQHLRKLFARGSLFVAAFLAIDGSMDLLLDLMAKPTTQLDVRCHRTRLDCKGLHGAAAPSNSAPCSIRRAGASQTWPPASGITLR